MRFEKSIHKVESGRPKGSHKSLDDWYRLVNSIYIDRNFFRTLDSVFLHFVEVSRSLQLAGTDRKRDVIPEEYLSKSLAWWFATCGRAGIPSIERMLWAKFPGICPYCQLERHDGSRCKESDSSKKVINWNFLKEYGEKNQSRMPRTLSGWQQMFQRIYPKDDNFSHSTNSQRISEEIGEVAESIKVISIAPKYFICEATDIFSWLMSFANKFDFDHVINKNERLRPDEYGKRLEDKLERDYPGMCNYCHFTICKCPPILPESLGRIAKEAPMEIVFPEGPGLFTPEQAIAHFSESQRILKIGNTDIEASKSELSALQDDLKNVKSNLSRQNGLSAQILVEFANLVGQLEALARQGNIVQSDVEKILAYVEDQPSASKQALVEVLSGIAGNTYHSLIFGALLKAFS